VYLSIRYNIRQDEKRVLKYYYAGGYGYVFDAQVYREYFLVEKKHAKFTQK